MDTKVVKKCAKSGFSAAGVRREGGGWWLKGLKGLK
jgi:hypothetical protein